MRLFKIRVDSVFPNHYVTLEGQHMGSWDTINTEQNPEILDQP